MEYFYTQRGDGHYYVRKDNQGGMIYYGPYPNRDTALEQMETARKNEITLSPAIQQNINAPTKDSFLENFPRLLR